MPSRASSATLLIAAIYLGALIFGRFLAEFSPSLLELIGERAISFVNFGAQEPQAAVIALGLALTSLVFLRTSAADRLAAATRILVQRRGFVAALAFATFAAAFVGSETVHHSFAYTLDEYAPLVQAAIFESGRLVGTFDADRIGDFDNYFPFFFHYDEEAGLFTQVYRPVHAMLIAAASSAGLGGFLNPSAAAASVGLVALVARRLAPQAPLAPGLAALMLATSSQVLAYAVSGYPWSLHLAVSLAWLAAFLRGGALGWAGVAAMGVVGIGLHQPQVHLAFAFPLLAAFALGWRRRLSWPRHAAFCFGALLAYVAATAFWLAWDNFALYWTTGEARFMPAGFGDLIALKSFFRLDQRVLDQIPLVHGLLTAGNLLRLCLWMSPAMLLLLVLGLANARRINADVAALAASAIFVFVVYVALMPNQMIGWGYRYATPLFSVFAVLAALATPKERRAANACLSLVGFWTLASVIALIPLRAAQIDAAVGPHAKAAREHSESGADYVIFEMSRFKFGGNLIRNGPDLDGRPLILTDAHLPLAFLEDLDQSIEWVTMRDLEDAGLLVLPRTYLYHPPGSTKAEHYVVCLPPPPGLSPAEAAAWAPQGPGFIAHCEAPLDSATSPAIRRGRDIRR